MLVTDVVDQLKSTTSKLDKIAILKSADSEMLDELLKETFDPNLLHHVRLKKSDIPAPGGHSLETVNNLVLEMLETIGVSQSSQYNRAEVIKVMKHLTSEDQDILFGVVNKSLKIGINIKTINEAIPGLIEVEPIQLAHKYDPDKKYNTDYWETSYKLDGMRIFAFHFHDKWYLYSRGKEYLGRRIDTLDHLQGELMELHDRTGWTYLEGEAYRHGWPFERIQGAVMSGVNLKEDAKKIQFHIFLAGKRRGRSPQKTEEVIIPTPTYLPNPMRSIIAMPTWWVENKKDSIYEALAEAVNEGYEGIMLRDPHNLLVCKRSHHLLKVKKSDVAGTVFTADCVVEDVIFDDFTVQSDGEVTTENILTKLQVRQEDNTQCLVGSGFTLDFRREVKDNPDILLGKTIEVEFQGFGSNGRMRFPRYKRVREDL